MKIEQQKPEQKFDAITITLETSYEADTILKQLEQAYWTKMGEDLAKELRKLLTRHN